MKDLQQYSLLRHNTFGIEAQCRRYVEYGFTDEAQQLVASLSEADAPLLILGGGSNLLLTADYRGTVVSPEPRFEVDAQAEEGDGDHVLVKSWAGTTFDELVGWCVARGYCGLENLSLIPGEVGASAVQNIGAYGVEAKDVITEVEAVEIATGKVWHISQEECDYSYRQSKFKHAWKDHFLITHVTYRLSRKFTPKLDYGNIRQMLDDEQISSLTPQKLREVIISIRRNKLPDPKEYGNAGSFFMNPIVDDETFRRLKSAFADLRYFKVEGGWKIPAGWMIDQCGWKGRSLGRAGVWPRQALVLYNRGGATGEDVVRLMQQIQKDVKAKFGLDIQPEVNIR